MLAIESGLRVYSTYSYQMESFPTSIGEAVRGHTWTRHSHPNYQKKLNIFYTPHYLI